ncbi:Glycosyl hydrolase family 3 N terminal domain-containing protein [Rathayibacter oskolensis]|uniref:Glycosyl hydrolase family 3 N terminal domain-containing protein n=1 Tax=Rathayibacter oskolensis TaxID=1891671 RepID=A0A1X7P0Y7_9MICO|nr:glycoside hydrolase family 3 N-terminal domain-containing protein [Rathayibacter oskolensis]SMH44215.1 Glycosyl hydrolase family 3 N terminal domain-containing protein [Rathayibacter oskolensis]
MTAKHFVGYSLPEGGMNLSAFDGGSRRTRDLFSFPFEAAIHDAGIASLTNSYSDVDGVPAAASHEIELAEGRMPTRSHSSSRPTATRRSVR